MPVTVAAQVEVCAAVIEEGVAVTVIPVTVGGTVTEIAAVPETFVYPACAEFAVHVAAPVPDGVNTPAAVIVPPVAVQVTAEL